MIQEIPNVLGFSTIWGFVEILIFGTFEISKAAVCVFFAMGRYIGDE